MRKQFRGDVAMMFTPEHNPEPKPGSRRLKAEYKNNKTTRSQQQAPCRKTLPVFKGPTKRPQGVSNKERTAEYMNPRSNKYKEGGRQLTWKDY
jgi:hypothetical protein